MRNGLIRVIAYTLLERCMSVAEGFFGLWGNEVDGSWWSFVRVDVDEVIDVDWGRRGIPIITAALLGTTAINEGSAASRNELGCWTATGLGVTGYVDDFRASRVELR